MEVLFRKVGPVGAARRPGNPGASRIGEGLPGVAVAVSGIAHGLLHRHTGVGLTLFRQTEQVLARIPHLAQTSDAVNRQLSGFSSRYMNLLAVFQI